MMSLFDINRVVDYEKCYLDSNKQIEELLQRIQVLEFENSNKQDIIEKQAAELDQYK